MNVTVCIEKGLSDVVGKPLKINDNVIGIVKNYNELTGYVILEIGNSIITDEMIDKVKKGFQNEDIKNEIINILNKPVNLGISSRKKLENW